MKLYKYLFVISIITGLSGSFVYANTLFNCNFESYAGFAYGDNVASFEGWSKSGTALTTVRDQSYTDWGGTKGLQYLLISNQYTSLYTPAIDTAAYKKVKISADVRPSGNALSDWGAYLILYGSDDKRFLRVMFKGDGTTDSKGIIQAYHGYSQTYDTGLTWQYSGKDTCYHLEIIIDQANRTWTLYVNGQTNESCMNKRWLSSSDGSKGTFTKLRFCGGKGDSTADGYSTFDAVKVEGIEYIWDASFESVGGYTAGADINGQNGWTANNPAEGGIARVEPPNYYYWQPRTGVNVLSVAGVTKMAYTPEFDTSDLAEVNISFDMNPSDYASDNSAGAIIALFGDDDKEITRFILSGNLAGAPTSEGDIQAWTGSDLVYDTGFDWAYIHPDVSSAYHFDITVDQIAKTWSLNINGQDLESATDQTWLSSDSDGSIGTLSYVGFGGGGVWDTSDPNTYTLYDGVWISGETDCEKVWDSGNGIQADISKDCKIDLEDFVLFSEEWMTDLLPQNN